MTGLGEQLKILGRHGLTYGVGMVLSRIIGFLMIPVYTHYLKPSDYGVYQLVGITLEVIGIVLSFGIANAVNRFYYDDKEVKDPNIVISTVCVVIPIISIVVLVVLSVFSKHLEFLLITDILEKVSSRLSKSVTNNIEPKIQDILSNITENSNTIKAIEENNKASLNEVYIKIKS